MGSRYFFQLLKNKSWKTKKLGADATKFLKIVKTEQKNLIGTISTQFLNGQIWVTKKWAPNIEQRIKNSGVWQIQWTITDHRKCKTCKFKVTGDFNLNEECFVHSNSKLWTVWLTQIFKYFFKILNIKKKRIVKNLAVIVKAFNYSEQGLD